MYVLHVYVLCIMYVYMEFQNFIYNITRTRAKVSPISCARNLHLGGDIFVARYAEASFFPDADGGRVDFFPSGREAFLLPLLPCDETASRIRPRRRRSSRRNTIPSWSYFRRVALLTHGSGSVSYDPRADALLEGRETYSWGVTERRERERKKKRY